jgi:phasin family protein
MPTTNHADASQTPANSFAKIFQVPGFDANTFVKFQHRNLEALNAANQTLVQGLQTVAQRQGKLVQQSVKQFQELLSLKPTNASVKETLVKQIDVAKTSFEKNVADSRELGDLVAKVGSEAADILNCRVVASLDEVKTAARSKAAVVDEVKAAAQDVVRAAAYPKTGGRVAVVA